MTILATFLYGLSCFSFGLVLWLYPREQSSLPFAHRLSLLALFGVLRGAAEWLALIASAPAAPAAAGWLRILFVVVSFGCLAQYAVETSSAPWSRAAAARAAPRALTLIGVGVALASPRAWAHVEVFARYALCLPGSMLAGYQHYRRSLALGADTPRSIVRDKKIAAAGFALYGLLAGAVVPREPILPASALQLLRAASAIVLAYGLMAALRLFDWERIRKLQTTNEALALSEALALRAGELASRTRELCLILDNVGQGFINVDLDGRPRAGHSAILETWLGPWDEGATVAEYLAHREPGAAAMFALGWESIVEDALPLELALDQMPRRIRAGARILDLAYKPIMEGSKLWQVLLVISDVTAAVERERGEAEQRELLAMFERILADRSGFLDFLGEAEGLVRALVEQEPTSRGEVTRPLHTLKGIAAMFGVSRLASLCHEIEGRMAESGAGLTAADRGELGELWHRVSTRLAGLVGERAPLRIEITQAEHHQLLSALASDTPRIDLLRMVEAWKLEPTSRRLARLADYARDLAARLGKAPIEVEIASNGLRLPAERWAPLWGALTHLVRNAVDHGLETAAGRAQAGKGPGGRIALRTAVRGQHVVVEIEDDGRGIDLEAVAVRASERGLPHATRDDLLGAVFEDGLTTRDAATEVSGRGVGMSAVRTACEALGGTIAVDTEPGRGTRFEVRVPSAPAPSAPSARSSGSTSWLDGA